MSPRRFSTRLFPTIPILVALQTLGCVGSIVETGEVANSTADAGANTAPGDCVPQSVASESGHHNPGTACLQCHGAGQGPDFTLGGTVYDGLNSDVPMAGVTVTLLDADGVELILTTSENGNFWTNQQLAYPVTTTTSNCPNTHPMLSTVQSAGADCNSGGCHTSGFRIHAQ